ncbi:MAG: thiamine-phosphate kinase [Candidatus Binatia bacterium]
MAASAKRPRAASGHRPESARSRLGEFELLARVRATVEKLGRGRGVRVGIGDDCAVVDGPRAGASFVLTTDTMVEGVHFRAGWLTPRELGVRAFRAAVSDIAAMGARPRHVLLSLEIPDTFAARDALALVRAVATDARGSGAALVGGNVSGGARVGVTVTVIGESAGTPLLRSAARVGDLVFVTGSLGGAAAGWRALSSGAVPDRTLATAYRRPPLRVDFAAALAARGLAHAVIDISDGLLQDLSHVARESRVAVRIDEARVPVHRAARRAATAGKGSPSPLELALTGGEDYELAFTAPAARRAAIERLAATHRTPVTVVGQIEKGEKREKREQGRAAVTDSAGRPFAVSAEGFDHLRERGAKATVHGQRAKPRAPKPRTR